MFSPTHSNRNQSLAAASSLFVKRMIIPTRIEAQQNDVNSSFLVLLLPLWYHSSLQVNPTYNGYERK